MGTNIMIFGAGANGQEAMRSMDGFGYNVMAFIDNDDAKWGKKVCGIPVISIQQYITEGHTEKIILGSIYKFQVEMADQLDRLGITNYEFFDRRKVYERVRLISYCSSAEMEDVILYHLLKREEEVFYIDVGSNDPFYYSVTKLLYDMKNACGIDIEPQPWLCELTERERPRDCVVCAACGSEEGKIKLYLQEGGSTVHPENVIMRDCDVLDVAVTTLADICRKYVPDGKRISFLKVDVEGHEQEVLEGADFSHFRPEIVVMESTVPRTMISTHEKWERILLNARYNHIYSKGVNRYYIAQECEGKYRKEITELDDLGQRYMISAMRSLRQ